MFFLFATKQINLTNKNFSFSNNLQSLKTGNQLNNFQRNVIERAFLLNPTYINSANSEQKIK